jgi:hypothetical protein
MALITNSGRVDKGEDRSDLMSNVRVTICAFDLVVGHMILMHELRGILGVQYLRFTMALETLPLRNMAIALNNVDMALLTGHPSGDIFSMVETPAFDFNVPLGFDMARGTTSNSTGDALFLLHPSSTDPIVMTDKTVGFVNSKVCPLNDLGMAGGASNFHPPF